MPLFQKSNVISAADKALLCDVVCILLYFPRSEYLAGGQYPDVISNRQLCAVFTAFKQVLAKVTEEMKPKGAPTPVEDTKGNKSAKTSTKGITSSLFKS